MRPSKKMKLRLDADTHEEVDRLVNPKRVKIDKCDDFIHLFATLVSEQVRSYEFWAFGSYLNIYGEVIDDDFGPHYGSAYNIHVQDYSLRFSSDGKLLRAYELLDPRVDPDDIVDEIVWILRRGVGVTDHGSVWAGKRDGSLW